MNNDMKKKAGDDIYYFLSNMIDDSFFIFDFDDFLKGIISFGKLFEYKTINKSVHPNDLIFLKDVCCIIRDSFNNKDLLLEDICYFAFLLQISHVSQADEYADYFMTYVKLKPLSENGQLRIGLCMLSASILREQEYRLVVYYKNKDYSVYSFLKKRWEYFSFSPLTVRQKEMLIWARQGYSLKESAVKMGISEKTVENMRRAIFEKFGVSTIEQAVLYALNRQLIDSFG